MRCCNKSKVLNVVTIKLKQRKAQERWLVSYKIISWRVRWSEKILSIITLFAIAALWTQVLNFAH